jgi:hypothetical protein
MKVRVSETVKKAFGKCWKRDVSLLIESALSAREMSDGKEAEFAALAEISIDITLTKEGATVTARPDFLPELDECEIRLPPSQTL